MVWLLSRGTCFGPFEEPLDALPRGNLRRPAEGLVRGADVGDVHLLVRGPPIREGHLELAAQLLFEEIHEVQ